MPAKEARKSDKFMHYGIAACEEAFQDSGLEVKDDSAHRFGVIMGSGIGGIHTIEQNYEKYTSAGPRRISPFFVPGSIVNMVSGHASIRYGMKGVNLALVSACATSTHCIGLGSRLIAYGDADVILAGGAEFATTMTAQTPTDQNFTSFLVDVMGLDEETSVLMQNEIINSIPSKLKCFSIHV